MTQLTTRKILLFTILFLVLFQAASYCEKYSFAVFGDNRDGNQIFTALIKTMNDDRSIKFAVNTGDLTSGGTEVQYKNYWKMCGAARVPVHDTLGNHDIGFLGAGRALFKEKYGQTYYSFEYGGCRFIIIDNTNGRKFDRKQYLWIKEQLGTDEPVFVFMHKPLFDVTGNYPNYIMTPKGDAEALEKLLKKSNVKYVFAGHIHGYGREELDGITYIITAGAGAPLYLPAFNGGYYHYVKVTVSGGKISDEVVRIK